MINELAVPPGTPARLDDRNAAAQLGLADKADGGRRREELVAQLGAFQPLLWAEKRASLLLVLQGMDGAGKDSTIRRVFAGLNPQGCRVVSFGRPHAGELAHDYLWRVHAAAPARGEIGIFNRSHYEDVVVARVRGLVPERQWRPRYRHIREFEQMLIDEGTTIVKVFLNISKDEQRRRLQERIDDPAKHWKFDPGDVEDRGRWDEYRAAYEEAMTETSTEAAPWYVVPGDRKWVRDVAILQLLVEALYRIDPQPPAPPANLAGVVID